MFGKEGSEEYYKNLKTWRDIETFVILMKQHKGDFSKLSPEEQEKYAQYYDIWLEIAK